MGWEVLAVPSGGLSRVSLLHPTVKSHPEVSPRQPTKKKKKKKKKLAVMYQ